MNAYFTTPKTILVAVGLELMLEAKRDGAPVVLCEITANEQGINVVSCDTVHGLMEFIGRVAHHGEDGLVRVVR